jgi:4'-phosphopantetheinyl transferase
MDRTAWTPLPDSLWALLSVDERARAALFFREADRARFSIGRSLLRHLVGGYTGVDPRALVFGSTQEGKPALEDGNGALRFNVSHSGDVILLAFGLESDLGVDVEQQRADVNIDDLARTCFSLPERAAIFSGRDAARRRFFEYWAAKESWIKADGRGMSIPLCDYTLAPGPADSFTVASLEGRTLDWSVRLLSVREGYSAAVTTRAHVDMVAIREMTRDGDAARLEQPAGDCDSAELDRKRGGTSGSDNLIKS